LHKLIAKGREIETKIKANKVVALKTDCKSERKQNKVVDFPPAPLSLSLSYPPTIKFLKIIFYELEELQSFLIPMETKVSLLLLLLC
jgi:hypothetical protein